MLGRYAHFFVVNRKFHHRRFGVPSSVSRSTEFIAQLWSVESAFRCAIAAAIKLGPLIA